MVKLVVSDIDGTLVGDGQGAEFLSPEYFQEIERLYDKGIRFMVCSGRQRQSVKKMFAPVADKIFLGCDGGSLVFDHEKLLFSKAIQKEKAWEIMEDASGIPLCDIMVCGTKRAYCRWEDSELYRWMTEGYQYDIEAVGDLKKIKDEIVKISLYHPKRVEELTKEDFRPRWEKEPGIKLTMAGIQWLDCVPSDAGKGTAVEFIQRKLGISKGETICFGDNQNDIDMFKKAGETYAVENAREEVKQCALHICGNFGKNGVLKVLQKI